MTPMQTQRLVESFVQQQLAVEEPNPQADEPCAAPCAAPLTLEGRLGLPARPILTQAMVPAEPWHAEIIRRIYSAPNQDHGLGA